eukprot:SAG31_NODE_4699_length_3025_cov_10.720096_4_plen_117_part_00
MDSWSYIMFYNMWGCDGWGDYLLETGMECTNARAFGIFAAIYFFTFIVFAAFLILNLFVGVVTTEMQHARETATKRRHMRGKMAVTAKLKNDAQFNAVQQRQNVEQLNPTFENEKS